MVERAALGGQVADAGPLADLRAANVEGTQVATAFEPGASQKTIELREPARVICSGTARNRDALITALDRLRAAAGVSDVHIEMTRGNTPLEFTFNFQWGGAN